jgi:hypothetical protein
MRRTTAALHLVDAALHTRARTGRQEPHEPQAIRELGADDPVIDVDARLGHRPALTRGVRCCVADLPGDGLRFVRDGTLTCALPSVYCGDHHSRPFRQSFARSSNNRTSSSAYEYDRKMRSRILMSYIYIPSNDASRQAANHDGESFD